MATDADALDQRLEAMAAAVCDDDPSTLDQRRADALGAIGHGTDHLACLCDRDDCDAGGSQASTVVVHVITHEESLSDDTPVELDGKEPGDPGRGNVPPPNHRPAPPPTRAGRADGWRHAACPIVGRQDRRHRQDRADPPSRRHPAAAPLHSDRVLATFIRCRDMTCRFPGCDEPAHHCDIDHTIAYPAGPTQASNLKCLCRKHHLLKTFGGWHDKQAPDGTVVWTSPNGQTYTTHPGSRILFPTLCRPTAAVTTRTAVSGADDAAARRLAMPRRTATRTQNRTQAINDERHTTRPSSKPRQKNTRVSGNRVRIPKMPVANPISPRDPDRHKATTRHRSDSNLIRGKPPSASCCT